ncbi:MAG: DUF4291 domain-containing protein [Nannocystales bacterium]
MIELDIAPYLSLRDTWPASGQVVLAQYDRDSIVVYQAFNAVTAAHAVEHQQLGGPRYSLDRMSWIKPNFMWMMYRCDWLQADDEQARVLAIRVRRAFFDTLLDTAVASSFGASGLESRDAWKRALRRSEVRLQWDPDHGPTGGKLARRAVQLGLRGTMLRRFVSEETLSIEDISDFVREQRTHRGALEALRVPVERVYARPSSAPRDPVAS